MKIPMVKWAKGYHVKLDDVYTPQDLQIVENKLNGPVTTPISDYKDLFYEQETDCSQNTESIGNNLVGDDQLKSDSQNNDIVSAPQPRKRIKSSRILLKADPGNGKSTFSKKVLVDWAKGDSEEFSAVFFASMNLARPGDEIENVIINQSPSLKRLGISKPKLQAILERFGASILIILDGMDEHDLSNSPHFLDLIKGAKPFACNLLVTSRSDKVAEIEHHFETVVQCRGFSQHNAKQYVSKILKNQHNVEPIVRFVSGQIFFSRPQIRCPMILLFICVLVNNDDNIDLDHLSNSLGEIFTKLIYNVYRAHCKETKIPFEKKRFERLLFSLGALANSMSVPRFVGYYDREALIHEVGREAFDSGLLIGHDDDYGLLTQDADICVTFAHALIGWLFNAFFFSRVLGHCETISGFQFSEFFKNLKLNLHYTALSDRVFIRFCLWFLSDRCSATYLEFPNRDEAFDQLALKISRFYDLAQLNFVELSSLLPALNVIQADMTKTLLAQSLSHCQNIRELYLSHLCPVDWILEHIGCLSSVKLIVNTGVLNVSRYEKLISMNILNADSHDLVIIESAAYPLNLMSHLGRFPGRCITLCVTGQYCTKPVDVAGYFSKYVSSLQFTDFRCASFGLCEIQRPPLLSSISFTNSGVDRNVLNALGTVMKNNTFPVLSDLSFEGCGSSLKGTLKLLFKSSCPTLKYLNLRKCELEQSDVPFLAAENGFLPNLTTLFFGFSIKPSELANRMPCCKKEHVIDESVFSIFGQHWPLLTTLSLHGLCKQQYKRIVPVLNTTFLPNLSDLAVHMWQHAAMWRKQQVQILTYAEAQTTPLILWEEIDQIDKMPEIKHSRLTHLTLQRFVCAATHLHSVALGALSCKLQKLDISHSSHVTGCLFILVGHSFPSLHTLILSDCQLNSRDLRNLAKACTKRKLPKLAMLDISHNSNLGGYLNLLLTCVIQHLKKIILIDCGLQVCDLKSLVLATSEGRLPKLRHLDISNNAEISGKIEHLFCFGQNWPDLLTLKSEQSHVFGKDFEMLVSKFNSHALGNLRELSVTCENTKLLSKKHNFEGSNLCNLKIVSPFLRGSKDNLFQFFSEVSKNGGFKKLRILSLVEANSKFTDDED